MIVDSSTSKRSTANRTMAPASGAGDPLGLAPVAPDAEAPGDVVGVDVAAALAGAPAEPAEPLGPGVASAAPSPVTV